MIETRRFPVPEVEPGAERLDIARRVYHALAAQDADRVITLCDGSGRMFARHDHGLSRDIQRLPHSGATPKRSLNGGQYWDRVAVTLGLWKKWPNRATWGARPGQVQEAVL